MNTYEYNFNQLFLKFYLSFFIMILVFLVSLYQVIIQGNDFNWLYFCFLICVPIIFFKEFITVDHPTKIVIDSEGVKFIFLHTNHYYKWNEIDSILIKEYGKLSDTVMIFINKPNLLKGKYWISKNGIANCDELIKYLKVRELWGQ